MENLRQIEDELRSFASEVDKKYPEVLDASIRALQTLKSVRESYISSIRNKDSKLSTPSLTQSSDLLAPFILFCNYSDASSRLVTAALNNISLQIQYDVVPYGEIKNIIRILSIQIQSPKFDAHVKLLQLIVLLATFMIKGRNVDGSLSHHSTMLLLTLPLTLNDNKLPASIRNAAYSTAKQVLSLILEDLIQQQEKSEWLINSSYLILEEMIKLASNSSNESTNSKTANLSLSFALDCIFEICDSFQRVHFPCHEVHKNIMKDLIPFIELHLRDIRKIYDLEYQQHGSTSAAAISSRIFRIVHWIISVQINSDFHSLSHIFVLLFHCIQPSFRDSDCNESSRKIPFEADSKSFKNDESTNIFSKLALNLSITSVLSRSPFSLVESGSSTKFSPQQHDLAYIEIHSRSLSSANSPPHVNYCRYLAIHPVVSTLNVFVAVARTLESLPMSKVYFKFVCQVLANSCTLLISCSTSIFLNSPSDVRDESVILTALRKILDLQLNDPFSGINELDGIIDSIQDYITSNVLKPIDVIHIGVLCLSLYLRYLLLFSYYNIADNGFCNEGNRYLALPLETQSVLRSSTIRSVDFNNFESESLKSALDQSYDGIIDCVTLLMKDSVSEVVLTSGIVLLHELCLIFGAVNMTRQNEIAISVLCKQSLPIWHQKDLMRQDSTPSTPSRKSLTDATLTTITKFDIRHFAMFSSLLRLTHVLGNVISDWDCIVDCFEQIYMHAKWPDVSFTADNFGNSSKELMHLTSIIERFPVFSISLCDDNLVKFMTSLVALSMNSLTAESKMSLIASGSENFHGDIINVIKECGNYGYPNSPTYLQRGMQEKTLTFSFRFAMETAKLNSFRIALIWQMMISHIRMMASMKSTTTRTLAIVAMFDLMLSSVKFHGDTGKSVIDEVIKNSMKDDDDKSGKLHPYLPMESIFAFQGSPRMEISPRESLKLADLYCCLKSIATIRFPDVRLNLLKALKLLMQENGELLGFGDRSGWKVIIEILSSIPYSSLTENDQKIWLESFHPGYTEDSHHSSNECSIQFETGWPQSSFQEGFNCLKLIVDEFLSQFLASIQLIAMLFDCLSLYSSQSTDLNIALTSVELLWKVCDGAINSKANPVQPSSTEEILHLMLTRIFQLTVDQRPEIRNCAINSFFSSTTAYSFFIRGKKYKAIIQDMVVPWFRLSEEKMSSATAEVNDQKNSKLSVHHSRDSPLKQWSETRVLAMRGLQRLLRSSVKMVILQSWFLSTWNDLLGVGMAVVFSTVSTLEQSSGSIDLFFGMLNITTESITDVTDEHGKSASVEQVERRKQELWSSCLSYLPSICLCATSYPDLTITMCQKLHRLYCDRKDAEFRYSDNMKFLCWSIAALSRPISTHASSSLGYSNENQTNRAIIELLKVIQPNHSNRAFMETYMSSLLEIILAVQPQLVSSAKMIHTQSIVPASDSLRKAVIEICTDSLQAEIRDRSKICFVRRSFSSMLLKQFLESIGSRRIAFFSDDFRSNMQMKCNALSSSMVTDRVVPINSTFHDGEISFWYFFFPKYNSVMELLFNTLDTEGLSESCKSSDTELELSLAIGIIFAPWPEKSLSGPSHSDLWDESIANATKDFLRRLLLCENGTSQSKIRLVDVMLKCLLQGLVIQQLFPNKLTLNYTDVLLWLLHNFKEFACEVFRSFDMISKHRWYMALIIITRQICCTVLMDHENNAFSHLLLEYFSLLCEIDRTETLTFGVTSNHGLWNLTSREITYSVDHLEKLWAEIMLGPPQITIETQVPTKSLAVMLLYNHCLDLISFESMQGDLRKSSLDMLRSLNPMYLLESLKDAVEQSVNLQTKCETLVHEVHQARSAAAFPF